MEPNTPRSQIGQAERIRNLLAIRVYLLLLRRCEVKTPCAAALFIL